MVRRCEKWGRSILSPIASAVLAFALILSSALLGMFLRSRLPEQHLSGDSKDVIKLATALIATMSALVLALLFASTRTSFEHTSAAVSHMTANLVELDGGTHSTEHEVAADARRAQKLDHMGYRVFRAHNSDVYENADSVLDALLAFIERRTQ